MVMIIKQNNNNNGGELKSAGTAWGFKSLGLGLAPGKILLRTLHFEYQETPFREISSLPTAYLP